MKTKTLTKPKKLEVGKSYRINSPQGNGLKSKKVHIDGVIPNPAYRPHDDWIDNAEDLIVYRKWSLRGRWYWYVSSYWEFCLWNDWKYEK